LINPAHRLTNGIQWSKTQLKNWQRKSKALQRQTYAVYLAYRDPRVPWYAKLFAILIIGYAFSPIDLIPDFIPVLGYVDDLILIPLGIRLIIRMIPDKVFTEYQEKAELTFKGKPKNWYLGTVIIMIWGLLLLWFGITIKRILINHWH
jgi:uncharacterized membrane protein YkvA (DUF1232 family)